MATKNNQPTPIVQADIRIEGLRAHFATMLRNAVKVTGDAIAKEPSLHKRDRGTCRFKITEKGEKALQNWRKLP